MDNYKLDSPQNLPKFSIFPSLKGHSPKRIFMGDKEKKESNSLAFLEQQKIFLKNMKKAKELIFSHKKKKNGRLSDKKRNESHKTQPSMNLYNFKIKTKDSYLQKLKQMHSGKKDSFDEYNDSCLRQCQSQFMPKPIYKFYSKQLKSKPLESSLKITELFNNKFSERTEIDQITPQQQKIYQKISKSIEDISNPSLSFITKKIQTKKILSKSVDRSDRNNVVLFFKSRKHRESLEKSSQKYLKYEKQFAIKQENKKKEDEEEEHYNIQGWQTKQNVSLDIYKH